MEVLSENWGLLAAGAATGLYLATMKYCAGGVMHSNTDLTGKIVIVTGGNTGIGEQTALELARRNATVVMACRDLEKANATHKRIVSKTGNARVEVMSLDLASLAAVRAFAAAFLAKYSQLHILVNNAGVMMTPEWKTKDGFEFQMGTNHLGHFLLTRLLLPTLVKSAPSRVVNLSSLAHQLSRPGSLTWDVDDLNFEKRKYDSGKAYGFSKLANVFFTKELARQMKEAGHDVTVVAVHPGVVATELGRYLPVNPVVYSVLANTLPFFKSPWQGAQTSLHCCLAPEVAQQSGLYFSDCKVKASSALSNDAEQAKKLWAISERLVGLAK